MGWRTLQACWLACWLASLTLKAAAGQFVSIDVDTIPVANAVIQQPTNFTFSFNASNLPAEVSNLTLEGSAPGVVWDLASLFNQSSTSLFRIQDGSFTISRLSILAGFGTGGSLELLPYGIALGLNAQLALRNVTLLTSCSGVQAYQSWLCGWDNIDMVEVGPGYVYFQNYQSSTASITAQAVMMTCNKANTTAVLANSTARQSTQAEVAVIFPPCCIQQVGSGQQLLDSAASLQRFSSIVNLIITQHISLPRTQMYVGPDGLGLGAPSSTTSDALQIVGTLRLRGRRGSPRRELDLALRVDVFDLTDNGTLYFENLFLANAAVGHDEVFPVSLLVGALWAVQFDRAAAARYSLHMIDSSIVVPSDLFRYLQHWANQQASVFPAIRDTAEWLRSYIFYSLNISDADNHNLVLRQRVGQGTFWQNSSLTDLPRTFQPLINATGITQLADDQYAPLNLTVPVYNSSQLLSLMQYSQASNLIVLKNLTFNGNVTEETPVPRYMYVAGRPGVYSTFIDFRGKSSLVQVARDVELKLRRLTLVNLGPLPYNVLPGLPSTIAPLGNLTILFWAFNVSRPFDVIKLQDVRIVVPKAELQLLREAADAVRLGTGSDGFQTQCSQQIRDTLLSVMTESQVTVDGNVLNFTRLQLPCCSGRSVIITDTAADLPVQLLDLKLSYGSTPKRQRISDWEIAVIVVVLVLCCSLLAGAGFLLWRRRQQALRLQQEKDIIHMVEVPGAPGYFYATNTRESNQASSKQSHPSNTSLEIRVTQVNTGQELGPGAAAYRVLNVEAINSITGRSVSTANSGKTESGGTARDEIKQMIQSMQPDAQEQEQIVFEQVVGQGSFGVVYKGIWRGLTVAVKTLLFQDCIDGAGKPSRQRQNAISEAAINTTLVHRNIVNTYAYDLKPVVAEETKMLDNVLGMPRDYKLFIIQEYCDSGTLSEAIDRGHFMHPVDTTRMMDRILQVALDIATGMDYIHGRNVIHGDLSPKNVLLKFNPKSASCFEAKVGDFGLSKRLQLNQTHISNVRQGTPFYIAPEVIQQGALGKDADVYSFGVILWELYFGRPPWRSPGIMGMHEADPQGTQHEPHRVLMASHIDYSLPASCPLDYAALVRACMLPHHKSRPSFNSIIWMLTEIQAKMKKPGSQQSNSPRVHKPVLSPNASSAGNSSVRNSSHVLISHSSASPLHLTAASSAGLLTSQTLLANSASTGNPGSAAVVHTNSSETSHHPLHLHPLSDSQRRRQQAGTPALVSGTERTAPAVAHLSVAEAIAAEIAKVQAWEREQQAAATAEQGVPARMPEGFPDGVAYSTGNGTDPVAAAQILTRPITTSRPASCNGSAAAGTSDPSSRCPAFPLTEGAAMQVSQDVANVTRAPQDVQGASQREQM